MGWKDKLEINPEPREEELKLSSGTLFVKIGIIVLSIIAIVGFGIKVIPGAVTVSKISGRSDLPIYCVNTIDQKVSLSFDAAWGDDDINKILDTLEKYKIKATFFMTGEWVSQYPKAVKAIAKAGHDLGNHSENHEQMTKLSSKECASEIMQVHDKVNNLTGIQMNLFRAPYGDYNNTVMETARECGYHTIQWSIDSLDWKDYGIDSILNKVLKNKDLENGSIILLHSGTKYTAETLELLIVGLQDLGYEIVPVSELIYTGKYAVDHTGKQFKK
ncbi:MAG: hypothetical protein K0R00_1586 [Herbinix sp.]|jgi:polysaccharide deacetylase family sporulation protein PdaB|nr:hypothetical protein [Herbinix sp.]